MYPYLWYNDLRWREPTTLDDIAYYFHARGDIIGVLEVIAVQVMVKRYDVVLLSAQVAQALFGVVYIVTS